MDLPNNWIEIKFDDVLELKNGFAFKSDDYSEKGISLVRISEIQDGKIDLTDCVRIPINKIVDGYYIEKGDLLIAMSGATTGKSGVFNSDEIAVQNQRVGNLKIKYSNTISKKYRDYLFSSERKEIESIAYGGAQPNISKSQISNLKFPLPPLAEQHRIVAKLEELFTNLDVSVAELKKAKAQIKRYRQSVLKSAFEGKLTEEWRTNNKSKETAEDLITKIKDERKKALGNKYRELPPVDTTNLPRLPTGWKWVRMDEIGSLGRGKSKHRPRDADFLYGGEYPFIQTGEIRSSNGKVTEYTQTYSEEGLKQSKLWPKGTLCITIAANIGETAILDIDACFPDSIVGFTSHEKYTSTILVRYYMLFSKDQIELLAPATAQKNINLEILSNLPIPYTYLNEQIKIVEEIERHFSVADATEKIIDQSLIQAERLRQSILKDAFTGKLVPQDPNDEPAEKLLERIRAEREKSFKD